jgi:hypothetical protein
VPSFRAYEVVPGDTLLSIARTFDTTARSIAYWNRGTYPNLDPEADTYAPNLIKAGWVLLLIPGAIVDPQTLPDQTPAAATQAPGATLPLESVVTPAPGQGALVSLIGSVFWTIFYVNSVALTCSRCCASARPLCSNQRLYPSAPPNWFLISRSRWSTSSSGTDTPCRFASWFTSVRLIIASSDAFPWVISSRCTSASCVIGSPFTVAITGPPAAGAPNAGVPPAVRTSPVIQNQCFMTWYSFYL